MLAGTPGSPNDFSVLLCRWITRPENERIALAQISPYTGRLEGINMSKLYLGGFVFYIKSDRRPFPKLLTKLMLYPARPVYALARQLLGSNDMIATRHTLERNAAFLNR